MGICRAVSNDKSVIYIGQSPISMQPSTARNIIRVSRNVGRNPLRFPPARFTLDTNGLDDHDDGDADSGMTLKNMLTRPELCEMLWLRFRRPQPTSFRSFASARDTSRFRRISLSVRISLPSHPRARNLAGVPI